MTKPRSRRPPCLASISPIAGKNKPLSFDFAGQTSQPRPLGRVAALA